MSNRVPPGERRKKISISPNPIVLRWIDRRTGLGHRFASRTHAFEYAIARLMARDDDEPKPVAKAKRRK